MAFVHAIQVRIACVHADLQALRTCPGGGPSLYVEVQDSYVAHPPTSMHPPLPIPARRWGVARGSLRR
jgi:hypothetical protein